MHPPGWLKIQSRYADGRGSTTHGSEIKGPVAKSYSSRLYKERIWELVSKLSQPNVVVKTLQKRFKYRTLLASSALLSLLP